MAQYPSLPFHGHAMCHVEKKEPQNLEIIYITLIICNTKATTIVVPYLGTTL